MVSGALPKRRENRLAQVATIDLGRRKQPRLATRCRRHCRLSDVRRYVQSRFQPWGRVLAGIRCSQALCGARHGVARGQGFLRARAPWRGATIARPHVKCLACAGRREGEGWDVPAVTHRLAEATPRFPPRPGAGFGGGVMACPAPLQMVASNFPLFKKPKGNLSEPKIRNWPPLH